MTRAQLIAALSLQLTAQRVTHPLRVGIDGVDAAGKTTLGDELAAELGRRGRSAIRASVDGFHHPAHIRRARGLESPEGYYRDSFDYPALIEALLAPLGPGGSRAYRTAVFDYRSDSPVDSPTRVAPADAVLIFDGIFLHRPELRDFWDFSIFVDVDFEVTIARAETRDLEYLGAAADVRERYERRYVPAQRLYLADCAPKERASAVVTNADPANPGLRLRDLG